MKAKLVGPEPGEIGTELWWEQLSSQNVYFQYLTQNDVRLVKKICEIAGPPSTALDIGSEGGRWALPLAQMGWRLTCTDVVADSLKRLRERIPAVRCILVKPTDRTLPCDDQSMDMVLCIEVFDVIMSDWIVPEIQRVLRSGGLFAGVYWNSQSPRGWAYKYIPGFATRHPSQYFVRPVTYPMWRRSLAQLGFTMAYERGTHWLPFRRFGNSRLIPVAATLEQRLGLSRLAAISPNVAFIARRA